MPEAKINSRKKNQRTVKAVIGGVSTEVTVVASRGDVLYGVALTARHAIAYLKLLLTEEGLTIDDIKTIGFYELQKEPRLLDNNIQVSTSVFVSNAYLDNDMKPRVEAKVRELIAKIPPVQIYEF